jgi:hypothetical protein
MNPARQFPPERFGSLRHTVLRCLAQVLEYDVPPARSRHDGGSDNPPDVVESAVSLAMAEPLDEFALLLEIGGNGLLNGLTASLAIRLYPCERLNIDLNLRSVGVGGEDVDALQVQVNPDALLRHDFRSLGNLKWQDHRSERDGDFAQWVF